MKVLSCLKALLLICCSIIICTSCDSCETSSVTFVSEEDERWLVYDQGDTILFENEAGQTLTYVHTLLTSENIPAEGYEATDECVDKMDVQVGSIIQDVKNAKPGLGTYILRRPDSLTVKLAVEGNDTWKIEETTPTYNTLNVNGQDYNNVYEINSDSTKDTGIKRLLYSKEKGFISIDFYDGRKLQLVTYKRRSNG
ncbi:hypothetical protein ACFSKU_01810 [Pontibacter silvestris]|uniref:Lipocalin-like domain-containing protein n=1 Tax=Pontibacter silvestris TaxID=2305183 RepID=A0ABW4WUV7_9BACT|nr:hypothetical protein [Pontibacter silvestris]MCC9137858.1 hypothetical protein [Pontibacter silvestris]